MKTSASRDGKSDCFVAIKLPQFLPLTLFFHACSRQWMLRIELHNIDAFGHVREIKCDI